MVVKQVPGFPGYYAREDGAILSTWSRGSRLRKPDLVQARVLIQNSVDPCGYRKITVTLNGKLKSVRAHRLVATAFHEKPKHRVEVRHLNGDCTDNRACNLAWGTHKENYADAIKHGVIRNGEDNPRAKLTIAQVLEIRKLVSDGVSHREIASRFGIHRNHVWAIYHRIFWKRI